MTTALALPLAPLIGAGGTLARGTGLVLLTTTKLSPLALLTLLLVLRIQSVPADVDRDHGPVAAVRWLLSYLLPAPGLGWLRRGSARLGRWAADRFAAARGRSRPPPPPLPRAAKRRRSSRPVNVLCMDGGGMRGRNLLVIAEEMELQTGKPLSSLFELVAGTSIGGCGALFLNKYPAPGEATHMARRALRMLQERCFAPDARSYGHLWRDGHLCLDRRREFMLELCGTRQPLRRQSS